MSNTPIVQLEADFGNGMEPVLLKGHDEVFEITDFNTFSPMQFNLKQGESVRVMAKAGTPNSPWINQNIIGKLILTSLEGQIQFLLKMKRGILPNAIQDLEATRPWENGEWGNWARTFPSNISTARQITDWTNHWQIFQGSAQRIDTIAAQSEAINGPFNLGQGIAQVFNFGEWNNGEGMIMAYTSERPQQSPTFLALRQIRQGNWWQWRYLPTVGTFTAPLDDDGNEMDVHECHYYLRDKVATQAKEIELLRSVIEEHLDIELPIIEPVTVERHKDPEGEEVENE